MISQTTPRPTTTLWRPCNDAELALVAQSGWLRWIPAERLDEFNDHIVGTIQVVASYGPEDSTR